LIARDGIASVAAALGASLAVGLAAIAPHDTPLAGRSTRGRASAPETACEGARGALPAMLPYSLRAGAFPGSGHPDVAVHVPPGFDATSRPGLILYFHGWEGCVASTFAADDEVCSDGGPPRAGSDLAAQVDAAGVNALLVAVELRADMATGEPGALAMPGGLRDLLRELFAGDLRDALGCTLDVDALDRVVVVAHSGGYQAAASVVELGDVPRITEVDLLDALYGADDVFLRWIETQRSRFDPRGVDGLRFVDLFTCCGGTADGSRALAARTGGALHAAGLAGALFVDDGESALDPIQLTHPVVFKRVPDPHGALPRAYLGALARAAGFAPIGNYRSYSLRPK
jgi:hypothetical protein